MKNRTSIRRLRLGVFLTTMSIAPVLYGTAVTRDLLHQLGVMVSPDIVWNSTDWIDTLNEVGALAQPRVKSSIISSCATMPLFQAYPALTRIPHVSLGSFPTLVQKLEVLGAAVGASHLYIKRDDLTGTVHADGTRCYGGNKVRKLEFELARALEHGCGAVMTFGCAGSNHAVATTTYAHALGLQCICMLMPQHNSSAVQKNLLAHVQHDTIIHYCADVPSRMIGTVCAWNDYKNTHGTYPYIIPTGGSTPLGCVGYVNAAFELKEQIDRGELPMPDIIYVTCGSQGTLAGLVVGCKAAGIRAHIIGVAVIPVKDQHAFTECCIQLAQKTSDLLRQYDAHFSDFTFTADDVCITYDWHGIGYGIPTPEGDRAVELFAKHERIVLDDTYTAKTAAALLHALQTDPSLQTKNVLFWNTYEGNGTAECTRHALNIDLPHCLHPYFLEPTV